MKTSLFIFILLFFINKYCDAQNSNFTSSTTTTSNQISGIINNYTPVLGFDNCGNILVVEDGSSFNIGDTVLLIQMKGAIIDSSNTSSFGNITDYKSAGNYEFNYVKSRTGNNIELKNVLLRSYEIPTGKVQLIRVPYYTSVNIKDTLTCLPWDGSKGGVLVLNVKDSVVLNANIYTSAKGFKGGNAQNLYNTSLACFVTDYCYPNGTISAAPKGESIFAPSPKIGSARGKNASGGGGGNGHNSGGGGGANGGGGGFGGYQLSDCGNAPFDNRGIGGLGLLYNNTGNKIFLGGGGGCGQTDNIGGINMKGGNGGGIIIINAQYFKTNGFNIINNGDSGQYCNSALYNCHDGNGGGGGGGTNLINVANFLDNTTMLCNGGNGANLTFFNGTNANQIGPGGGGGGGICWFNSSSLPSNVAVFNNPGLNGVILQNNNNPWGATAGTAGSTLFNLVMPITSAPFKANINSVNFNAVQTSCPAYNFTGIASTNNFPIINWQWDFGDGNYGNSQNVSHIYAATGSFNVKLIVTDANGCKDSLFKTINAGTLTIVKSPDTAICFGTSIQLMVNGGTNYLWNASSDLSNINVNNPIATPKSSTTYYVTITNSITNCKATDSIKVNLLPKPIFKRPSDVSICENNTVFLSGNNLPVYRYTWSPKTYLSDSTINNPLFIPGVSTAYSLNVRDTVCNFDSSFNNILVTVNIVPALSVTKSNDINCSQTFSNLMVITNANTILWSPSESLDKITSSNPIASPDTTTTYRVVVSNNNGCADSASILVNVDFTGGVSKIFIPNVFTPNGDGINDCFGIKNQVQVKKLTFIIYNRWGERVFFTNNPNECWDGNFKSQKADSGNYVYYINAQTSCGQIEKKGNLILLR